jgi:hypothetical protein
MTAATDVLRHLLARRRTNIEDAKSKQVSKKLKESDRNEKIELQCLTKNRFNIKDIKYVVIVSSSTVNTRILKF